MRVGKLTERIEFFSPTIVDNEGQVEETYSSEGTVFAYVMSSKGSEAMEAARANAKQIIRIKIRYNDLSPEYGWQFEWEGQRYNITDIDRTMRRQDELYMNGELLEAV
jgi:SPP1 family predicted phage head-tail adaptor